MSFRGDDRGAAVQVGAVILFGFLVIAVAGWQATVVPQENARVEYAHSQRVTDDMQDVRNVVVSAPGETSLRSVGVEMAPSYPPRSIFVNPGPPSGTLRTVGTDDPGLAVRVNNATATDAEAADVWNGTPHARYGTGGIVYESGYNVFTEAPDTVYENSVLYTVGNDGTVVNVTGQDVVDGRTVTLVTLDGTLSRTTAGTYTVDFESLSTASTSVAVTNASNGNVTVSFPSRRGAGWWNASLAESGELDEFGGHVVDVRATSLGTFNNVTVELAGGVTYDLRMAKVGVGDGADRPGKHYVVDVAGDGTSVQSGTTRQLVVEVRDRYNNPVSGVTVEVNGSDTDLNGGSLDATEATTGSDGRATFAYTGGSAGTATVVVNVSDDATPLSRELATFEVAVTGSGTGTGSTSNGAYAVDWQDPDGDNPSGPLSSCTASDCTWDVGADGDSSLDLRALTDPTVQDLSTEFAVNNSSVGTLSGSDPSTDASGAATTTLDAVENGTVKVYVITGGASDVVNVTVRNVTGGADQAPTASFTYSPSFPTTGQTIEFDPSASSDPENNLTEYRWDFDGDGNVDRTTSSATNVTYAYGDDGSYDVTLTVEDNASNTDSETRTVTVGNRAPSASVTTTCTQLSCAFDASGSSDPDGSIVDYTWDFGDGNSSYSSGADPTVDHTYASPGTYTVTVTVTDDDGATATASTTVTVTQVTTGVVYADANQYVHTVDRNGNVLTFDSLGSAEAMSPADVDFDGDGVDEIAYVNGSAGITLVDRNNESRPVLTGGAKKTAIAVGTWQGSAASVFYASSNDGSLYRKAPGGSAVELADFGGQSVVSVGGIGDVDGDGNDEIAVALSNGKLGVVDDDGRALEPNVNIGSNNNWGIGTPADFDGDGTARVPVVDGNNNLNLVSCSIQTTGGGKNIDCTETTVVNGGATKTAVGAYDYDGDGVADLVYADTNLQIAYYDPADGSNGAVTDDGGNAIGVYGAGGVR
jgi:PKD repeat protein